MINDKTITYGENDKSIIMETTNNVDYTTGKKFKVHSKNRFKRSIYFRSLILTFRQCTTQISNLSAFNKHTRKALSVIIALFFMSLIKRSLPLSFLMYFISWMKNNPKCGLAAYIIVYALHMVFFLPGTPLTVGAGYIFKHTFGWTIGIALCSIISLFGSFVGGILCFLFGRYFIRDTVRRWSKKYPLLDDIDAAVSENGFKVMCIIYLIPVIPLGFVSYIIGTTSMPVIEFAKAKIAALPLTMIYVFLGASAGTLMIHESKISQRKYNSTWSKINDDHDLHGKDDFVFTPKLILSGILLSIISTVFITIKMKKELKKILDKRKNINEHFASD